MSVLQVRRATPADARELQRFYVDRPAQGTGVARELMAAVHAAAADRVLVASIGPPAQDAR